MQKMLYDCNGLLTQLSHVKRKVFDQYVIFSEEHEELKKKRAELDASDPKIKELISVLDQWKDESIEQTFKGVARHFREVFSKLVQGGQGHLVMTRKKDGDANDEDEDGPCEPEVEGRIEKYIGVKVKACFLYGQGRNSVYETVVWGTEDSCGINTDVCYPTMRPSSILHL